MLHILIYVVTNCKNWTKIVKVFAEYAVIYLVRLLRSICMYMILPGCRTFREEIKLFFAWFKSQTDLIMYKLYELDRIYGY